MLAVGAPALKAATALLAFIHAVSPHHLGSTDKLRQERGMFNLMKQLGRGDLVCFPLPCWLDAIWRWIC